MSRAPRVSVLLAVFNGGKYLGEAIQSVLNQTFQDFELILINDGSTDGTAEVIERWRREDARVRVYDQGQLGLVASLNRGLDLARGEYIARMDADDVSLPDRVAAQVAFMDAHKTVGICGTWIETFGSGGGDVRRYPTEDDMIRSCLLFESVIAHPSVVMRRDLFKAGGLRYDAASLHAEDYDLWVTAASHTQFANIPAVLLRYRVHENQVVRMRESEKLASAQRIRLRQLDRLRLRPNEQELELHRALSSWEFPSTEEFIVAAHGWLLKLKSANDVAGVYPPSAFLRVLGQRWSAVCMPATHLGLWTLTEFWRSPLRAAAGLTGKRLIKFGVKCGIGWKHDA